MGEEALYTRLLSYLFTSEVNRERIWAVYGVTAQAPIRLRLNMKWLLPI